MGKTITIDDDAYKLLLSLKEGPGDSFTKVIRRYVHKPIEDGRELFRHIQQNPPPEVDPAILELVRKGRGSRSGGRR
jgi:predicted CopG family antitoxin